MVGVVVVVGAADIGGVMIRKAVHEIDLWTGNDEVVGGEGIVNVRITYCLVFSKTRKGGAIEKWINLVLVSAPAICECH